MEFNQLKTELLLPLSNRYHIIAKMYSLLQKLSVINALPLNSDAHHLIKELCFHKIKKIPKDDIRYQLLSDIPTKEYDEKDDTAYVYLQIKENKDYYIVFVSDRVINEFEFQIQILEYSQIEEVNEISLIAAHSLSLY